MTASDMLDAIRLVNAAMRAIDAGLLEDLPDVDESPRVERSKLVACRVWRGIAHVVTAQ